MLLTNIPEGTRSVLASLPETDFELLQQLPGVRVQRVEIVMVRLNAQFFAELAARAGDQADRRFAAALAATYPDNAWPVHVRQQTGYSGCTAFEDGQLLETYLAWSAVERDFPDRYVAAVARERDAVVRAATRSTCACGDAASVVRELERFAAALTPGHPILAAVDERLAALDEGRPGIRFACNSG